MNNIMTFEGNNVEIIFINGEPYFEIYSTGMALGYFVKNKMGKAYPNKARIDIVIKNAEITGCLHDVNTYFNEEQLFDFMLEAKTEKVKPFRKWVTKEVLPSINHTGSYSIENENQEYTFKGEKVMTVKQFNRMIGIDDKGVVQYWLHNDKSLIANKDYKLLNGKELAEFKKKNNISSMVSSLFIIFKTGANKLMKVLKVDTKENKNKALEYFKDEVVVYEEPKAMNNQELINEIWDDATFASGYLSQVMVSTSLNNESLDKHRNSLATIERALICLREEVFQLL